MFFLRRRTPQIASLLLGLGLVAAAKLPLFWLQSRFLVWGASAFVTCVLVGLIGVLALRSGGRLRALRLAAPAILLSACTFLYLLIVESSVGRYSMTFLVMFLVALYLENLRRSESGPAGSNASQLVHLCFVLDAVSMFFLLAFIFGLAAFYSVSLPSAAVAVGAVAAFLTHETLWRAGFGSRGHAGLVIAAAAVGIEGYVALSLLPTSHLVNAAVGVILFSAGLHVIKEVMSGAGEFKYFRKELVGSLSLAVLLLTTARWS